MKARMRAGKNCLSPDSVTSGPHTNRWHRKKKQSCYHYPSPPNPLPGVATCVVLWRTPCCISLCEEQHALCVVLWTTLCCISLCEEHHALCVVLWTTPCCISLCGIVKNTKQYQFVWYCEQHHALCVVLWTTPSCISLCGTVNNTMLYVWYCEPHRPVSGLVCASASHVFDSLAACLGYGRGTFSSLPHPAPM